MNLIKSKWFLVLVALVLVGAVGSFWVVGRTVLVSGNYMEDAKAQIASGDVAAAIIQLKNAVQENPEDGEARILLGEVYLRVGEFGGAEKELRAAVSAGIDEKRAVLMLAESYLRQRKYQTILDEIIPGERGTDIEARLLAYIGYGHLGLGNLEEAEKAFKLSLEKKPDDTKGIMGTALLLRGQRDNIGAERRVDELLKIAPEDIDALILKADLRRRDQDIDAAIDYYSRAIAVDTRHISARLGRALLLVGRNEDEQAEQDVAVARRQVPKHPIAAYLTALLQAKRGQSEDAITTLLGTGEFLRTYPAGLYLLASLQVAKEQLEQAASQLRQIQQLLPGEPTSLKLLASINLRRNQPDKAIELLAPLVNDTTTDNELISLLASAYVRSGKPQEAAVLFERVVQDRPEDMLSKARLAATKLQAGQGEAAIEDLNKILKQQPDSLQAHVLLVLTYLQRSDLDAALGAAQELSEKVDNSPLGHNLAGGIYIRKKDFAKAREEFDKALANNGEFVPALLNLAQLEVADGNVERGKELFNKVVELDASNVPSMLALSRLAFSDRDTKAGVNWLKRAVKARPQAIQPRLRLIDHYLVSRDFSEALVEARDFNQTLPDNAMAVDALGRVQLASGQASSAATTFQKLVKLAPNTPLAHHRLGQAQLEVKNFGAARESLEKSIELSPKYAQAYLALIATDLRQDRIDDALKTAERMRKEFPDSAIADAARGDILLQAGRQEEAVEAYSTVVEKQATSRNVIRLYQARRAAGQKDQAVAGLVDWLKDNEEDNAVRFALASHYLTSGDYDNALKHHEAIYEASKDNEVVLNNLAWLYDRKGDKRAVQLAENAYDRAVESPAIKDTLGWILVRNGDIERGAKLLREAARSLPSNTEIQYHYAYLLNLQGQGDRAREVLDRALRGNVSSFPDLEDAKALLKSLQP